MSSWLGSQQYTKIGEQNESGENAQSWLRRTWQRGRIHFFYVILLVFVAVVSNNTSLDRLRQKYYGDEPVKSELRRKTPIVCSEGL